MNDLEHARRLLALARKDLKALAGMTDPAVFEIEIFGFHAQQAAEKALKAWATSKSLEYPLRHDLGELLGLLNESGEQTGDFRELRALTQFAVQFRYEELASPAPPVERLATIEAITKLLDYVQTLLI